MLILGQHVTIRIEMATHQSAEKSSHKNSALLVPFQSGSPRGNTASFARGSARVCDKLNEKDRKDTSRIHFLKLKPILFLILSLGYLLPDPSQGTL